VWLRAATTTRAPAAARPWAMPSPSHPFPPVTTATLPLRSNIGPSGASYPKSCEGTWWPRAGRLRTVFARTEMTPSCCCAIPVTRRYGSATSATRWRAKIGGVTITFAIPVSSSRERKTKPFAVPGRWRTMTLPATWTLAPSSTPASSRALTTPRRRSDARRSAIEHAQPRGARDVDRQDPQAVALRVLHDGRRVIEPHRLVVEKRRVKRRRIVDAQVRARVGGQREAGGVRVVDEQVVREEVVISLDREVIRFLDPDGIDGYDSIPVQIRFRQTAQLGRVEVPSQP